MITTTAATDTQRLAYTLQLADNALILGQRLGEWCGHAPVLEQDIALTNIALDLIGEARSLYQYAATLAGGDATEDSMAYLRYEHEYRNVLLVEYPNTDWAYTIVRQFFFDAFHYFLYDALRHSQDTTIAAIAEKSLKEVTYHLRFSAEWVIRLGDGTPVSHQKMQHAINDLWAYTGEFFVPSAADIAAWQAGYGAELGPLKTQWEERVQRILAEATLQLPIATWTQKGGKQGVHTEHMGYLLADLQYMQRAYPNMQW